MSRRLSVSVVTPAGEVVVSARYVEENGVVMLQMTVQGSHQAREMVKPIGGK